MRIAMIGTGYVGLVSGTCFASFGVDVTCVDKDPEKIRKLENGEVPFYEPGLQALVEKQRKAGWLAFSTRSREAVQNADAVFIAVGTPSRGSGGEADLSHVFAAVQEVAESLQGYTLIVTKSTVPVGTSRQVEALIKEINPRAEFDVCSNPEFLREGAAIEDFMRPDRIIVGAETERARDIIRQLYRPLYLNETPVLFTTLETAELTKYAANAFLATKITFINEIADLCEKTGANVQDVARGMGLDGRIGSKFLHAGPGFGGSCFPKDTKALVEIGKFFSAPLSIVESVVAINNSRPTEMARKIAETCGDHLDGQRIAVLGVSFKPNTDDVREAPALAIIPELQKRGAIIAAHDPIAANNAAKDLEGVEWCDDPYRAADGADALVIITEWNEYRALDFQRLGQSMRHKRMIDLRNIYKLEDMQNSGFEYVSVGRPAIAAPPVQLQSVTER